jgi:hypothetical protein
MLRSLALASLDIPRRAQVRRNPAGTDVIAAKAMRATLNATSLCGGSNDRNEHNGQHPAGFRRIFPERKTPPAKYAGVGPPRKKPAFIALIAHQLDPPHRFVAYRVALITLAAITSVPTGFSDGSPAFANARQKPAQLPRVAD